MTSDELGWQKEKEDEVQQQGGLIAQQSSDSVRQRVEASCPSCVVVLDGIRDAVWALRNGDSNNREEPCAGEYFLAIVMALSDATGASTMTDDLRKQLLKLLFVTASASNPTVVMVEGARVLQYLRKMLSDTDYGEGNPEMDACVLKCMGSILSCHKEGKSTWNSSYVVRSLLSTLGRAGDPDPQVRKAAYSAVHEVLKSTYRVSSQVPQKIVSKFCTEMLSQIEKKDSVKAKYLLKLISEISSWIGGSRASTLCESCLKLASLDSPSIYTDVMRCISGIVQAQHIPPMSPSSISHILHWVLEELHRPNQEHKPGATAFSQLVGSCIVRTMQLDRATAREMLPLAVSSLIELCEGSVPAIHKAAAANINLVFQAVVDQEMIYGAISTTTKPFDFIASLLGRVLSTIQGLMQHKYRLSWRYTLPVIGRLFLHLKEASYPVLARTLKELGQLQTKLLDAPSSAVPPGSQAAIHEALGYAIEGIGIERTLMVMPLRPAGTQDSTGVSNDRAWLIPLLKKHGSKCPSGFCQLSYFQKGILTIAKHCDSLCQCPTSLSANEAKTQSLRVVQLWQLFPCFCASPSDIALSLWDLATVIASELQNTRYPDIIPPICHGLQLLVNCCKKHHCAALEAGGMVTEDKDYQKTAQEAMTVMGSVCTKLLPLLFNLLEKHAAHHENTEMRVNTPTQVLSAVSALASVSPPPFVANLFKKLLHKLLEKRAAGLFSIPVTPPSATSTTETSASSGSQSETCLAAITTQSNLACMYLDLIACMMPQLKLDCVMLCYRAIKPMVQDDQIPAIQKRAYKALLELCHHHSQFIVSDPSDLQAFVDLLVGSLYNCHVKARRMRLKCLSYMAENFQPNNEEHTVATRAIISEVILCMKDSNGRTREAASELLVTLGNADAVGFVKLVAAGLGGLSPHMRSGALMALIVLNRTYAHSKSPLRQERVADMTPDVIRTVLLLLQEPYKQVVQAALEFLKVATGGLDRQHLDPLINPICNAMFPDNGALVVNKCIAEVKGVLRKLTRKCGFDAVRATMPESHRKIISAMQKLSEMELRDKMNKHTAAVTNHDDGLGRSTDHLPSSVLLREGRDKPLGNVDNSDDEHIIDLLDDDTLKNMHLPGRVANELTNDFGTDSSDDDDSNGSNNHGMRMQLDKDGRFLIPSDIDGSKPDSTKDEKNVSGPPSLAVERVQRSSKATSVEEQGGHELTKRQRGGDFSADKGQRVAKRMKMPPIKLPGSEYKSSKGGGDVQRKDQALEPHAYIPLDASKLTRHLKHKRGQNIAQMYSAVVKGRRGKKGYHPRSRRPKKGHK